MSEKLTGYKGFDKDLKCRDFQFEVGKSYEHDGVVKLCAQGFHWVENALDALSYYAPGSSRYAEIEADGVSGEKELDSKRVSSGILIKAEISLQAIIEASVKFVFSSVQASKDTTATTGESANAATTGPESIAAAIGINNKAKAAKGSWIVVAEWKQKPDYSWEVVSVKTAKIDGKELKADTFYALKGGKFEESK